MFGRRLNSIGVYRVSEESDFVHAEFAFCGVYHSAVIVEAVEQDFQMFAMLVFVVRSYEEIIDVRVDEIEPACDFVDETLTCLRDVPKSEHHVCCFEKSERCCYRGIFDVFGRNRNLVVRADEIDL